MMIELKDLQGMIGSVWQVCPADSQDSDQQLFSLLNLRSRELIFTHATAAEILSYVASTLPRRADSKDSQALCGLINFSESRLTYGVAYTASGWFQGERAEVSDDRCPIESSVPLSGDQVAEIIAADLEKYGFTVDPTDVKVHSIRVVAPDEDYP